MKVPGKKNKVTRVIILIETVSCCVLIAISCIFPVIPSIFTADWCALSASILLASKLRNSRIPYSYYSSAFPLNLDQE